MKKHTLQKNLVPPGRASELAQTPAFAPFELSFARLERLVLLGILIGGCWLDLTADALTGCGELTPGHWGKPSIKMTKFS